MEHPDASVHLGFHAEEVRNTRVLHFGAQFTTANLAEDATASE